GKGEALEIPHSPEKEPVSCLTDWHYSMKNVWYNKNIINKIECCSVDNLQSLLSIIAAKMKSMIYQK
ncbi:hypothetical protein SJZ92_24080, partial [Escherichia coli]